MDDMTQTQLKTHIAHDWAAALVEFLNYDGKGKTVYMDASMKRFGFSAEEQAKLRGLLAPIYDARFAERSAAEAEEKLVEETAKIEGNPYRFERNVVGGKLGDKWQRAPLVTPKSLFERYLAFAAELFDRGVLYRRVGLCQQCRRFFESTATRGPSPDFCSTAHHNAYSNERLRGEGYFENYYRDAKAKQRDRAKELLKKFPIDRVHKMTGLSTKQLMTIIAEEEKEQAKQRRAQQKGRRKK
jgi:hypothetical protein